MIDIFFLSYGRSEFTKASWAALQENTDWSRIRDLYVYTDGFEMDFPLLPVRKEPVICPDRCGGPVAITNRYLDDTGANPVEMFAKIDNDLILCPGWLEECCQVMDRHREVDLLGVEPTPFYNAREQVNWFFRFQGLHLNGSERRAEKCRHIGGIGLFRRRAFEGRDRMAADMRLGFTRWQTTHPEVVKAWVWPPLPVFLLDHLPFEPWRSLNLEYEAVGQQRRQWGEYPAQCRMLWEWWHRA
jgi:hypothetical protein